MKNKQFIFVISALVVSLFYVFNCEAASTNEIKFSIPSGWQITPKEKLPQSPISTWVINTTNTNKGAVILVMRELGLLPLQALKNEYEKSFPKRQANYKQIVSEIRDAKGLGQHLYMLYNALTQNGSDSRTLMYVISGKKGRYIVTMKSHPDSGAKFDSDLITVCKSIRAAN